MSMTYLKGRVGEGENEEGDEDEDEERWMR